MVCNVIVRRISQYGCHSGDRPGNDIVPRHRVSTATRRSSPCATGISQHFPQSAGWNTMPEDLWNSTIAVVARPLTRRAWQPVTSPPSASPTSARPRWSGTGKPARRSQRDCLAGPAHGRILCELKGGGHEEEVTKRTGLLLDPYFSGTKVTGFCDNVDGARSGPKPANWLSAPSTAFLIWRLTGGKHHVTDATNAARTLMYNIAENRWDDSLLGIADVPRPCSGSPRQCCRFRLRQTPIFWARQIPMLGVAGTSRLPPSAMPVSSPAC